MPHRRKLSNKVRLSAYVELVVFSGVSNAAADTIFHLVIIRTAKCNRPPLVFRRPYGRSGGAGGGGSSDGIGIVFVVVLSLRDRISKSCTGHVVIAR